MILVKIKLGRTPDSGLPKFMISLYRRPTRMKFWSFVGQAYVGYWCIMGIYRGIYFDLWYYHIPRR